MRAGIAPEQVLARIADVGFVADELARRPSEGACDLTRIDSDHLALAGHSVGAWVVQAMAGQRPDGEHAPLIDRRFRAFVAMSSSGPADAAMAKAQFGGIGRPLLVITSNADGVPANASAASACSPAHRPMAARRCCNWTAATTCCLPATPARPPTIWPGRTAWRA